MDPLPYTTGAGTTGGVEYYMVRDMEVGWGGMEAWGKGMWVMGVIYDVGYGDMCVIIKKGIVSTIGKMELRVG